MTDDDSSPSSPKERLELTLEDQAELLDLTHDSILVLDGDGTILYWNRGAQDLYGWSASEALGQDSQALLATSAPGLLSARQPVVSTYGQRREVPEPRIQAYWQPEPHGYRLEIRVPASMVGSQLGFEIVDVDGLRLHYARTCRQWVERLRERADEARALAGERTYRTWLLYLTCSAVAFSEGSIALYQVLTRKHGDPKVSRAPHTREHLYGRAFL